MGEREDGKGGLVGRVGGQGEEAGPLRTGGRPGMLPPGGAASPLLRCSSIPAPPRVPKAAPGRAGPHRAGQFGKVLPRKLDHVSHSQDGAEGGLVRVEAAGLHVGGGQIGKEVPPGQGGGEERGRAQGQVETGLPPLDSLQPS